MQVIKSELMYKNFNYSCNLFSITQPTKCCALNNFKLK